MVPPGRHSPAELLTHKRIRGIRCVQVSPRMGSSMCGLPRGHTAINGLSPNQQQFQPKSKAMVVQEPRQWSLEYKTQQRKHILKKKTLR